MKGPERAGAVGATRNIEQAPYRENQEEVSGGIVHENTKSRVPQNRQWRVLCYWGIRVTRIRAAQIACATCGLTNGSKIRRGFLQACTLVWSSWYALCVPQNMDALSLSGARELASRHLPRTKEVIAESCRHAGLQFMNGAGRWGSHHFVAWLVGSYHAAARSSAPTRPGDHRDRVDPSSPTARHAKGVRPPMTSAALHSLLDRFTAGVALLGFFFFFTLGGETMPAMDTVTLLAPGRGLSS